MKDNEFSVVKPGLWVLVCAFIGMALSPGPVFLGSLGLFVQPFEEEFGWSRSAIMFSMSIMTIGMIIAAPVGGKLIDRLGTRPVLLISVFILGSGLGILSLGISSLNYFYALMFVLGILTIGSQSISYTRLLSTWFKQHYGLAIGIAASGLGAGYFLVPLVVGWGLSYRGWQFSYLVMSILVLGVSLVMIYFLAHNNSMSGRETFRNPNEGETEQEQLHGMSLGEAVRTQTFWLIALVIGIFSCVLTGIVPHIVSIGKSHGLEVEHAVYLASGFGITTFVSRLTVGYLLDRFFAPLLAIIFFSISTVGLLMFVFCQTFEQLMLAAVFVGIGFGAETDLIAYFIRRYFGLKAFGEIYGYIFASFLLGAGMGPTLIGAAFDFYGQYLEALLTMIGLSIVGCLLLMKMAPYPDQAIVATSG